MTGSYYDNNMYMQNNGTKKADRWSVFDQYDQSSTSAMSSLQCNWLSMHKVQFMEQHVGFLKKPKNQERDIDCGAVRRVCPF